MSQSSAPIRSVTGPTAADGYQPFGSGNGPGPETPPDPSECLTGPLVVL